MKIWVVRNFFFTSLLYIFQQSASLKKLWRHNKIIKSRATFKKKSEVRKGIAVHQTTRLTIRKQENSIVGCKIDCKMSRTLCKVTQYCVLNKEKRALVPSLLDGFARRQLGCNMKLCRENVELTCKDLDTRKEMMINNWLMVFLE